MNQTSGWWQLNDTDRNIDHGGEVQQNQYSQIDTIDDIWLINGPGL